MPNRVTQRPMPIEQSIHWKPLHDSHYVLASLQPGDGGRRKIFVRQKVLAHVEALMRATHGRRVFGLLLGELLRCPVTGADYLVIESVAEQHPLTDEGQLAGGIEQALARVTNGKRAQVLGWYRSVASVEAKPSANTIAIHSAHFTEPWQTALVLADSPRLPGGAFFLHDVVNARWFYAPFYELADDAPAAHQPKVTCVSWPQYLTAEDVVPVARDPAPALHHLVEVPEEQPDVPPERPRAEPALTRAPRTDLEPYAAPTVEPADSRWSPLSVEADARGRLDAGAQPDTVMEDAARLAVPPPLAPHDVDAGETPERYLERAAARFSDRPAKTAIIDDRDQRRVSGHAARRVSDADDTAAGDEPARFLELARAEGFFVAARFDSVSQTGRAETLWVLNEPFSGMLLTVVGTDAEVIDASLHYNLRTDDAGVRRIPFPEHRDLESLTIYARESCVDALRARCRQLRATNALEREWKVSPTILFLMPNEWQSDAVSSGGADAISELNGARIAALPEGVRSQFRLAGQSDTRS